MLVRVSVSSSLPGLSGPDLKGKFLDRQDSRGEREYQPVGLRTNPGGLHWLPARDKESPMLGFFETLGPLELIIILAVVLLLFGAKRLPEMARSLGRSSREFKKGLREGHEDDEAEAKKSADSKPADTKAD
jgi:TatA/E family protein of Tat protein translocase